MTPEEAHAYLEDLQREFTTHRRAYADNLIEANGAAILALEKQIPKKPMDTNVVQFETYNILFGDCPNCEERISQVARFCYKCGQAIDWSGAHNDEIH